MSSENVELLKATLPEEVDLVQILESDDPIGVLVGDAGLVAADLHVEFAGTQSGAPALHYSGPDGLLEGWRDWLEPWDSYRISFEAFFDAGDQVVTLATVRARTGRYGVDVEHSPAAVWTLRDGKLAAVNFFLDRADALAFAGLPSHN